jgi:hypothetical protein
VTGARLHERFPELADTLPFVRLGTAPTPVRRCDLGTTAELWCKDESGYGDGGWGGNKVRKLEWLLPEARRRGARTILTVGGTGTNWGLATALYGRAHGIDTTLALVDQPVDDHVRAQLRRLENSGATLYFTHSKLRTILAAPWLYLRRIRAGKRPYLLPAGGSSPVGALGYVEAACELAAQVARSPRVNSPSHSTSSRPSDPAEPPPASHSACGWPGCARTSSASSSTTRSPSTRSTSSASPDGPSTCCAPAERASRRSSCGPRTSR